MKKSLKNIIAILIMLLFALSITSCSISVKTENTEETKEATVKSEVNEKSPIASEPWFLNGIYKILNVETGLDMLVKGDGTVILKNMEQDIESIGIINDTYDNAKFLYKSYYGEDVVKTIEGSGEYEYVDTNPTTRTVFYDLDGKEVGLEIKNAFGASCATKDKIIFHDSERYADIEMKSFDVNTKEIVNLGYSNADVFNGMLLLSTSSFDDNVEKEETVIYDEDFNEIKKIEGYSTDSVNTDKGVSIICLRRKDKSSESTYKFNYLNKDLDFIFDEDVDERMWDSSTYPILTVRRGDIAFDYDFKNLQKVSEDKPYAESLTYYEEERLKADKYEPMRKKIQDENDTYTYVSTFMHDDRVLFIAYRKSDDVIDFSPVDIYSEQGEKIASFDELTSYYSEDGYLYVNCDTVYNMDMHVVKHFDKKIRIDRIGKFGKAYYMDSMDLDYNSVKNFTVFDVNFDPIYENVLRMESFTYDDYMIIADENETKFIDKDGNVVKTIDKPIDISGWYEDGVNYKAFTDLKNNREGIIDSEFNIILDNMKSVSALKEKFFTYQNGFKYGLMDYEGRPILTYSIFDSMREDARPEDFDGDFVD